MIMFLILLLEIKFTMRMFRSRDIRELKVIAIWKRVQGLLSSWTFHAVYRTHFGTHRAHTGCSYDI